jgi:DNA repair protein RAD50
MKKTSPEVLAANKSDLAEWTKELERLQGLLPIEASRNRLKAVELPDLERKIKEQEALIPDISAKAEKVSL